MNLDQFDSLSTRDFKNGAVRDEIRTVFQQRDDLLAALRPFAEKCPNDARLANRIDHPVTITVRLKHLRAARAAIAEMEA